jgi:hypothetical protein
MQLLAKAEAAAKEEADPYGMTARKAKTAATATATATATAKEEADPCGMTARKAKAKAKPRQKTRPRQRQLQMLAAGEGDEATHADR